MARSGATVKVALAQIPDLGNYPNQYEYPVRAVVLSVNYPTARRRVPELERHRIRKYQGPEPEQLLQNTVKTIKLIFLSY